MAKHKILFVDDEKNILNALKRLFHKNDDIETFTAAGPKEAVKILSSTDIDLVVSDEKMPQISGSQFLQYVKDKYPNIIRMILTGYANISSVISAINKGEAYRYLTKPWDDNDLIITVQKALEYADLKKKNVEMDKIIGQQNSELKELNRQLEKKVQERTDQLQRVVNGLKLTNSILKENFQEIILLLTGVVSMFQKELGAHSRRVADLSERICDNMEVKEEDKEMIISSALLHDIGLAGANNDVFIKDLEHLDDAEKQFYYQHPVIGAEIVGSVKTLTKIAAIIRSHHEEFNSEGFPDGLRGRKIPLGSRIIKISSDYDDLIFKKGMSQEKALQAIMKKSGASFDPKIFDIFYRIIEKRTPRDSDTSSRVKIKDFKPGMYLAEDVVMSNGVLYMPKGMLLNQSIVEKIANYSSMLNLEEEISVKFTV